MNTSLYIILMVISNLCFSFAFFGFGLNRGLNENKPRWFYFDKYGGFYYSEGDCLKHHHVFFKVKCKSLDEAWKAFDRYTKQ